MNWINYLFDKNCIMTDIGIFTGCKDTQQVVHNNTKVTVTSPKAELYYPAILTSHSDSV